MVCTKVKVSFYANSYSSFLVSSLPLRQILEGGEIPKVIDYACGAGHFLTEYARQIKPIVEELAHLEIYMTRELKKKGLFLCFVNIMSR